MFSYLCMTKGEKTGPYAISAIEMVLYTEYQMIAFVSQTGIAMAVKVVRLN